MDKETLKNLIEIETEKKIGEIFKELLKIADGEFDLSMDNLKRLNTKDFDERELIRKIKRDTNDIRVKSIEIWKENGLYTYKVNLKDEIGELNEIYRTSI